MQNEIVIPIEYWRLYPGEESIAAIKMDENGECAGLLSYTNEILAPFKYDFMFWPSNGRYKMSYNNQWGFLDEQGNEVIPAQYDIIEEFGDKRDFTIVYTHNKGISRQSSFPGSDMNFDFHLFQYAVVNKDGEVLYQCPYIFKTETSTSPFKDWLVSDTEYPVMDLSSKLYKTEKIDINGFYGARGIPNAKKYSYEFAFISWGQYQGFPELEVVEWDDSFTYELVEYVGHN